MFTVPELAQFLTPLHYRKLAFHYSTLPLYNQYYLPQPTADVVLPDQRRIRYAGPLTNLPDPHEAVISVTRLVIDHDSAFVTLGIKAEGVVGRFRLGRTAAQRWRVVKAEVYEI